MKNYLINLLIAFDQAVNAVLGGYPDETISLRVARERDLDGKQWACVLCRVLDLFQKDHCSRVITNKRISIAYRKL